MINIDNLPGLDECLGERKHWQSKAQSLSKDMQRMMSLAADIVQLREENSRIRHRLEVIGLLTYLCNGFHKTNAGVSLCVFGRANRMIFSVSV